MNDLKFKAMGIRFRSLVKHHLEVKMKKILIALAILISVAALGESSNEEVAALFAKIRAYKDASNDTKRFKSSERQQFRKAEEQLRQYLENNYEAISRNSH